jgi:DnaK suppressor protein
VPEIVTPGAQSAAYMNQKDLDRFREVLQRLQARIRGDVQHLSTEALDGNGDSRSPTHMAELGTSTFEQDFSLRVMEGDQEVLEQIRDALRKMDSGNFGLCEGCLEDGKSHSKASIPKARLNAIPYARNCVACEERRESHFRY